MNKPTKQTLSDLLSVKESLEWLIRNSSEGDRLVNTNETLKRAYFQLTQNDQLRCVRCPVVKPTRRSLSAHVALVHGRAS